MDSSRVRARHACVVLRLEEEGDVLLSARKRKRKRRPTGTSIVGSLYGEEGLLQFAKAYQEATGYQPPAAP